ncbi:CpaE family protein [Nitratireductor sp. ZSWI3]|uniref:AAA family ATPase n=1 Tax=Nitratireductor sp. ZSWI3 TaxID=2966359 RepID=UPI00214FD10B|nr:pilus assembly protein [Nitratireductor sp. ZSWI3]MCR4264855.1 pilus assembly protein [Nitratireductor sp. ZSWI3]
MNAIHQKVQPTRRKRVALYSSDDGFRSEIAARLEALAIYDVQSGGVEEFLNGAGKDNRPTLIVLDVADGVMLDDRRLAAARASWGQVPIIAVSAELPPERMRNLVRINAADWLRKPVDAKELISAVTFHDSGDQSHGCRIITCVGAGGGAGATTMALAATDHLVRKSKQRAADTCLVDLDFQNANCGAYLNLFNEFDLDGVIGQPDRLDVELMDVIKLTRDPGFTLYTFERPALPYEPRGSDFVLRLLDLAAYRFEDVVVDLPHVETPWSNAVLSASDRIFLVFELNIASLRQAKRLYLKIRALRNNSADGITLVANKHKRKLFGNHFSHRELQKIFKDKSIRSVPYDRELLTDALNRALLPTEVHARARLNKDFAKLFKECLDDRER